VKEELLDEDSFASAFEYDSELNYEKEFGKDHVPAIYTI
jgi:hypothetical protein